MSRLIYFSTTKPSGFFQIIAQHTNKSGLRWKYQNTKITIGRCRHCTDIIIISIIKGHWIFCY